MKIWASDLDQYQFWKESDYLSTDDFIRRLRREEEPGPSAFAGSALHKALEEASKDLDASWDDITVTGRNGLEYHFTFEGVMSITLPQEREVRFEEVFDVSGVPVTVVGKADGVNGIEVIEYKLTERALPEKFVRSMQWRLYLLMSGARRVTYQIFRGRANKDKTHWRIIGVEELTQYPYPGMENDCLRAIKEFTMFCRKHCPDVLEK